MKISTFALASVSLAAISSAVSAQTAPAQPTNQGNTAAEGSTDQTAAPAQANEIIVTAQRRKERVVDVPISITVANQAQLERQQVNTVSDLNRIAPALEVNSAPGQNTGGGGTIRGIGTQTFNQGAAASVGVVVDQVSQGNANLSDLFDVSRVEVLKGPQGTLFGLTTSAGVINITTNAPDPHRIEGRIRTELSSAGTAGSKYGDQVVQAMLNVPLSDTAAIRIAGNLNRRQGPDYDVTNHRYDDVNRFGGRARLLWKPTDRLTFNLIGDYSEATTTGGGDFFTFVKADSSTGQILPLPTPFPVPDDVAGRLASCGVTAHEGNRDYCTTDFPTARTFNYGASLEADYDAGPVTLTSISAYRGNRIDGRGPASNIFRSDPLILNITTTPQDSKLNLVTQEFRVTSPSNQFFEYTAGAFFSRQTSLAQPYNFDLSLDLAPGFAIPILENLGSRNHVTDESAAVFGQGTFHITKQLRLIAGGRYTSDTLKLNGENLGTAFAAGADAYGYQARYKTDVVSYRFGAQYDLNRKAMVYVTTSRGFKGGQIALPSDGSQPATVLKAEIPTDYEAGFKATLFGGWIADFNIFDEKFRNFQAQQCESNAQGSLNCQSTNIDGVKSRGAELDFFGRVSRGLTLNTGFIYAKTTYPTGYLGTDSTAAHPDIIGGTQLAYAPRYKFTLSGEYEQRLGTGFKGFVAADTVWKSRIRYEATSIEGASFRAHWTVGGRIGLRTDDDRYAAALFVRNLFNVHEPLIMQSGFPYNGAANIGAMYGPNAFRNVGLSLDAKF